MNKKYRLAALATHPIQYQAPLFRALAQRPEIDLTVLFYTDWGLKSYHDDGFGAEVKWDVPLLDGYRSEFLPNWSPKPNPSRFWGVINPRVVRSLRRGNFDAVWIHGWSKFSDWLAMLTAFARGIPVLIRGETTLIPVLSLWKTMVKKVVLKSLFKNVSGFLAIGRFNAEFYQVYGVPKEKIFYVPYAVDNEFFLSKAVDLVPKKNELKQKFGIPVDLPLILFSGKLSNVKRPMDLLRAFVRVIKDKKCALIFVGDGVLRGDMEAYVRENDIPHVFFVGFQNQTQLPTFYAMADLFVLPSGTEPWGLVVNEAMCFGLPAIVSDKVGSGGDLVKEGANGYIYQSGNETELANCLKILLTDEALRNKMGKSSLEIIQKWSYQGAVDGIFSCLRMINNHGSF